MGRGDDRFAGRDRIRESWQEVSDSIDRHRTRTHRVLAQVDAMLADADAFRASRLAARRHRLSVGASDRVGFNAGIACAARIVLDAAQTARASSNPGEAKRLDGLAATIAREMLPPGGDPEE